MAWPSLRVVARAGLHAQDAFDVSVYEKLLIVVMITDTVLDVLLLHWALLIKKQRKKELRPGA